MRRPAAHGSVNGTYRVCGNAAGDAQSRQEGDIAMRSLVRNNIWVVLVALAFLLTAGPADVQAAGCDMDPPADDYVNNFVNALVADLDGLVEQEDIDGLVDGILAGGQLMIVFSDPHTEMLGTPEPNTRECTVGPGYWRTHSEYGPAPYDANWSLLDNGADTEFFLSGQTYLEVFWTPPAGGNVYYILARHYIGTELNRLSGAGMPADVEAAFDAATALFEMYTPEDALALRQHDRHEWLDLVGLLEGYNEGDLGPGHCDEYDDDLDDLIDDLVDDIVPPMNGTPQPNTIECTLSQGYWKTHSEYGPAPYDGNWSLLPDGADTDFFLSSQSYHDVFWTSTRGNVYYILARQYMAAELNSLSGAPMPVDVTEVFDAATVMFETYMPEEDGYVRDLYARGSRRASRSRPVVLDRAGRYPRRLQQRVGGPRSLLG